MGGAACPLHDPGNDRSFERGSDLQTARRGSLTTPAKPAGEREGDAALTPRPGTRSLCRRRELLHQPGTILGGAPAKIDPETTQKVPARIGGLVSATGTSQPATPTTRASGQGCGLPRP